MYTSYMPKPNSAIKSSFLASFEQPRAIMAEYEEKPADLGQEDSVSKKSKHCRSTCKCCMIFWTSLNTIAILAVAVVLVILFLRSEGVWPKQVEMTASSSTNATPFTISEESWNSLQQTLQQHDDILNNLTAHCTELLVNSSIFGEVVLESDFDAFKLQVDEELSFLNETIVNLTTMYIRTESLLNSLNNTLTLVSTGLEEARTNISSLAVRVGSLESNLHSATEELSKALGQIGQIQTTMANHEQRIVALENSEGTLVPSIVLLTATLAFAFV